MKSELEKEIFEILEENIDFYHWGEDGFCTYGVSGLEEAAEEIAERFSKRISHREQEVIGPDLTNKTGSV